MRRPGPFILLLAFLTPSACIIDHSLGQTAGDARGSTSADTGGSTSGSGDDPSVSGGLATTGDDGDDGATFGSDGGPTSTGGEDLPPCRQSEDSLTWQYDGADYGPLEGVDENFFAALDGICTVGVVDAPPPVAGIYEWTLPLSCSLSGHIGNDPGISGDFFPLIRMTGTLSSTQVLASLGDEVRMKYVQDGLGFHFSAWLVLERSDGIVVLDLMDAGFIDPFQSFGGPEVQGVFGDEPWHGPLFVGTMDAECGASVTACNDEPMALSVGWDGVDATLLHAGQLGTIGTSIEGLEVHMSVNKAQRTLMTRCFDIPPAVYAMAAWAVER